MKRLFTAVALVCCALSAQAQTQAPDIGITAQDTYAKVQQADAKVLFVDVRDPVEVMFVFSVELITSQPSFVYLN